MRLFMYQNITYESLVSVCSRGAKAMNIRLAGKGYPDSNTSPASMLITNSFEINIKSFHKQKMQYRHTIEENFRCQFKKVKDFRDPKMLTGMMEARKAKHLFWVQPCS